MHKALQALQSPLEHSVGVRRQSLALPIAALRPEGAGRAPHQRQGRGGVAVQQMEEQHSPQILNLWKSEPKTEPWHHHDGCCRGMGQWKGEGKAD